ncbi:MAG: hypothetical protein WCQ99_10270 [Pseudomonadota bacterium]
MIFFIKRYFHKISLLRSWLILALLPCVVLLAFKASRPDRFTVYQDIAITAEAPVALTTSPTDFQTLGWFSEHQEDFFLDTFTLKALYNQLHPAIAADQKNGLYLQLLNHIKDSMSLTGAKADTAQIKYLGKDKVAGQTFVDFYAKRLVKKAEDGRKRSEMQAAQEAQQGTALQNPSSAENKAAQIGLTGDAVLVEHKALWRQDRLLPAAVLLMLSSIVFLIIVAFIELFDPAFKSERQVAAYLKLPIFGALPNLSTMSHSMGIKSPG